MKNHEAEELHDELITETKDHAHTLNKWRKDIDRCNVLQSENDTLRTRLEAVEKANGELVARIEHALSCLLEAGSNKKHDPSWIRPMTMTRKEVNDACIQAYHQPQTCLDTAEALKGEG